MAPEEPDFGQMKKAYDQALALADRLSKETEANDNKAGLACTRDAVERICDTDEETAEIIQQVILGILLKDLFWKEGAWTASQLGVSLGWYLRGMHEERKGLDEISPEDFEE